MRAAALVIALVGTWVVPARADVCEGAAPSIVVESARRVMTLCEDGEAVATFPVAIGQNGVGKEKEGDRKTPLGTYPLGKPRPSKGYGTFIPIGFPTVAQKERGITGGAIGIHGPERRLRAFGSLAVALGWTYGCVAVGSDAEMMSISRWMGRRSLSIEIR
jgi:murein L,D-transpeptidase YafK